MKVLLIYATYSSGTQTASEMVENDLSSYFLLTRKQVQDVDISDLENKDLIIMATPSWKVNGKQGQPHEFYFPFFEQVAHFPWTNQKVAFFGLGDSSYDIVCGGVLELERHFSSLGAEVVVPTCRLIDFYFNQKGNEKTLHDWTQNLIQKYH